MGTRKPKDAAQAGDEAKNEALAAGAPADDAAALGTVVEEKVGEATGNEDSGLAGPTATTSDATTSDASDASTTPPSPGDDPESVLDRRLARLQTIAEEAEFDGGTLFGDVLECVLDLFKHRPKLWSAMPPSERQDVTRHIEGVVKTMIDRIVLVVAEDDSTTLQATMLAAFNVKGETVEAKIKLDHVDEDGLLEAYRLAGKKIVVIDASSQRFMSKRRDIDHGKDQEDLPFGDDSRTPAPAAALAPPPDDSNLADGADQSSASGRATAQADEGDAWGIFDTGRSEWLIDEKGGDDGWTSNKADAGKWSREEADKLLPDFNDNGADTSVVLRQLD